MRNELTKIQCVGPESECFVKILNYYHNEILGHEYQEIPIGLLIIKLMKILEKTGNRSLITKALIITIQFFRRVPADIYNNQGIEIDLLPLKFKKKALSQLKQEFLLE